MDSSQAFCAILCSVMLVMFLKALLFPEKPPRRAPEERRKSLTTIQQNRPSETSKTVPEMHDVMELRHLSMVDLQNFNGQFGKVTDRYWREIFRRQNDTHHPDHINVSRLQTANIITALDEHLPPGAIQELTITGLVPKPFSSRKCEVMKYLRERLSSSPNVELSFKGDRLRIANPNN